MIFEQLSAAAAEAALRCQPSIAVIIPCFRVSRHLADVVGAIGPEVAAIYCVDDACPDRSADQVEGPLVDPRVRVLRHDRNRGVGGATLTGYRAALADGHDILVKIDGDGQMNPRLIGRFVQPIVEGAADYTKGNRFFFLENVKGMPIARLFGNSVLSFLTKLSSGYWNIFDPTNGYTAVHREVAAHLICRKIDQRYFFESDMLLNLYLLRAVVQDIPMAAIYAEEESSLSIRRVVVPFLLKNLRNIGRRFFIHYLIRDFSLITLEVIVGLLLLAFGIMAGVGFWFGSITSGEAATAGQVMIAALPILSGTQFLLSALNFDIRNVPTIARAAAKMSDDSLLPTENVRPHRYSGIDG